MVMSTLTIPQHFRVRLLLQATGTSTRVSDKRPLVCLAVLILIDMTILRKPFRIQDRLEGIATTVAGGQRGVGLVREDACLQRVFHVVWNIKVLAML